jgi:quinohemoprotein ethanol dehydrogenase
MKVNALDDPALVLNEADVVAGRAASVQCAACHGIGFHSAGTPGPDLRESGIALRLDTFAPFVKAGRMEAGMPSFPTLTDEQLRQIHAYLRAQSREVLGLRKPSGVPPPNAKL